VRGKQLKSARSLDCPPHPNPLPHLRGGEGEGRQSPRALKKYRSRFSSRFFRVPALAAGSRTCACVSCGNGSGTRAFSATGFRLRDFDRNGCRRCRTSAKARSGAGVHEAGQRPAGGNRAAMAVLLSRFRFFWMRLRRRQAQCRGNKKARIAGIPRTGPFQAHV